MGDPGLPNVDEPSANANTLFTWLEQQPKSQAEQLAEALFVQLLERSAKSRVSSVNACAKLCGFVQHCVRSSTRPPVVAWAFQETTALRLFHFYIEWNEKDQHRSLKLVLDLVAQLILQNPDPATQSSLRAEVLQTLVAIISRKSTRPLVKSSVGSLHYLLNKGVYKFEDVAQAYDRETSAGTGLPAQAGPSLTVWQRFVENMFAWMTLHYVCPVAGKLLVSIFAYLRTASGSNGGPLFTSFTVELWLQWLRDGLSTHPGILEDVKLYFFIPLFKADRTSSLQLLESLNSYQFSVDTPTKTTESKGVDVDNAALLQLAALEVGKRSGLVDDPGLNLTGRASRSIVLNENVLDDVLARSSSDVRSLALSLLVSSQSTTKPYSATAFALLQKYLPSYHAESDAKFRYELLAHTRDMAVRLKSAITVMQKRLQGPPTNEAEEEVKSDAKAKAKANAKSLTIDESHVKQALDEHEAFLSWYLAFLRGELAPTASYQRHFTSLKATAWLFRLRRDVSGGVSDALDPVIARRFFQDSAWIRCVLDLMTDPFDDVREAATSLLALAPRELVRAPLFHTAQSSPSAPSSCSLWDNLVEFSGRAGVRASRTARQDHADGAARCHGLLCSWAVDLSAQKTVLSSVLDVLEQRIGAAESDLGSAAVHSPVHGEFASVRYIWTVLARSKYSENDLRELVAVQERIVKSCERIWRIVKHVLCDDSPEGHMPEDMEDAVGLDSKDLLSYSFRSINESSNTMRSIVAPLRFSRVKGTLIPDRAVFERIGNLAFAQLSALRHRGALTTVAQTFTLCCQMAQDPLMTEPGTPDNKTLIMAWYRGTLDCIHSQVSTTRRSAGIPGLFSGILASSAPRPTFEEAIQTACEIAQTPPHERETDGSRLPQVHAFNCLRDVFRSSLLSKRAERLLPECLQLAANSLRSEVWAIRNCALLLLRSLIDCLFGTGESKTSLESGWDGRTIRVSYNKYPTLPGVLLNLLQEDTDNRSGPVRKDAGLLQIEKQQAAAESVFPALDILRRAGPPEAYRAELYGAVLQHLGSHLWHVREMAARTTCSFLITQDWAAELRRLLTDEASTSANRQHGILLLTRFVLGRVGETTKDSVPEHLPELLSLVDSFAGRNSSFSPCPEVWAAYLETRNTILGLSLALEVPLQQPIEAASFASTCSAGDVPSALLKVQTVLQSNLIAVTQDNRSILRDLAMSVALSDPDTAVRLLNTMPTLWLAGSRKTTDHAAHLCSVYTCICLETAAAAEVRAAGLWHLADAMDYIFTSGEPQLLPKTETLKRVWATTSTGAMNPALSWAVLRASGPILAAAVSAQRDSTMSHPFSILNWAELVGRAGSADQTFDTRMAAAKALRSFALCGEASFGLSTLPDEELLPAMFCMYDSLNDDDDEIRDVAAEAVGALLGTALISGEAARRLPLWMANRFGHMPTFQAQAISRMEGQAVPVAAWPPAKTLLAAALQFDDALFLVEEQNLFIDEVREAQRWAEAVRSQSETLLDECLVSWLADGLASLVEQINGPDGDDGPLGWTAAPGVFAVCARLVIGAKTAAKSRDSGADGDDRLANLLEQFQQAGEARRIHGLLLAVARA